MSCLDYIFLSNVEEKVVCILTSFRETLFTSFLIHTIKKKKKKWQSCQLEKEFKSSVFASVVHAKERSLINFPKAEEAALGRKETMLTSDT